MRAQSCAAVATFRKTLAIAVVCTMGMCRLGSVQAKDVDRIGSESQTLARVFAAWKARQESVKSLHFAWEYRLAFPKGYRFPESPVVGGLKAPGIHIESDGVHDTLPTSEFWVEGADRFRDDFTLVGYSESNDWKPSERFSLTTNGAKHTCSKLLIGSPRPQVVVWKDDTPTRSRDPQIAARSNDLAPLLLTFRPFRRASGWNPERCRLVSESELVGETRCITIQMDDYTHSERCWVDPDRDYVIVKWEKRQQHGLPSVSVAIDYQNDKVHGWIPVRWTRELPGLAADATGKAEAEVTRYAVNEPVPASTFAPEFPPGTAIADLSVQPIPPKGAAAHKPAKVRRKPAYDPFAEPLKDLEAALKTAKGQNKRVLIDIGANWCGDCLALAEVFHTNAEVTAALKPGFVLVLIDFENPIGQQIYERYNPNHRSRGIPHFVVLDSDGTLLKSEASEFAVGHYDIPNLKAFIAKWSASK
ncbi:MAG TPA: thioredoxin family protein [Planctomycetaceae bacterium]|nr:thioredoxin family protein [Planctomycetaceae bacterium]